MTRETKVGLVLAGSFLSLVGVVVMARMHKHEEPPPNEPVAQTIHRRTEQESRNQKSASVDKPQKVVPATHHEQGDEKSGPGKLEPAPAPPAEFNVVANDPKAADGRKPSEDDEQSRKLKELAQAAGKSATTIPGKPLELPEPTNPLAKNDGPPPLPAPDPLMTLPKAPDPAGQQRPKDDPVVQLPEAKPTPDVKFETPGQDKLRNEASAQNPVLPGEPMPPNQEKGTTPAPGVNPHQIPSPSTPMPTPPIPEPKLPEPKLPEPKAAEPKTSAGVPLPPLGSETPAPPLGQPPKGQTPSPQTPLGQTPAPPLGTASHNDGVPAPPLGSEPKATSPPITIGATTLPKVKEFDVITHVCPPQDTTFAAVSQRYYGSDKYAEALLQYNREHFLGKQDLAAIPSQTRVGQKVFVPPFDILEAKYGALIGRGPSTAATPPVNAVPPLNVAPPQKSAGLPTNPLATNPAPAIGRPTAVAPATPSKDKTIPYQVRQPTQSILEIARETLGDARRWGEIYRYNPNLRELNAIPEGTVVQLPEYAKVR